jgi:hypothetical protein
MLSSRRVRAEVWGVTVIFGWLQNGCPAGQRLGAEHIQRGARQVAAVQQRQQVVVHQVRAARHVDDIAARLQARQRVAVEDVLRVRRQRQQVDQHAAGRQEVVEALPPAENRAHRHAPWG